MKAPEESLSRQISALDEGLLPNTDTCNGGESPHCDVRYPSIAAYLGSKNDQYRPLS
jgi:hypothetical protein